MCGRARLSSDVSEIKLVFSIPPERSTPNIPANWNAAPTEDLAVVRYDTLAGQRSLDVMRWGLVPFWAKDIKIGFANINDNAEIGELIACGSHVILFTTGRGSVVGSAISPVIKVCANPETFVEAEAEEGS